MDGPVSERDEKEVVSSGRCPAIACERNIRHRQNICHAREGGQDSRIGRSCVASLVQSGQYYPYVFQDEQSQLDRVGPKEHD